MFFKSLLSFFLANILLQQNIVKAQDVLNYYFHSEKNLTWYDAPIFCRGMNMQPLSIQSDQEFNYIQTYLNQNYDDTAHFWTSGVDITPNSSKGDPGQVWTDTGIQIEPHYWGTNEPNDLGLTGYEMCVMFLYYYNATGFMINDVDCAMLYGVICKELIQEPCEPITTSIPCPECPTTEIPSTCSPQECESCPTPQSCPPETTTEDWTGEFVCTDEGQFPDPLDCHVFHVCIPYNETFIDDAFQCPENLVYCPEELICDYDEICPCNTTFK